MKNVIIGTAGHVDHGKTALVKALTGIDTDRLVEEKRRGVTIEPGFAYLDFNDGSRAGLIDVPGHERFIRNMLAGAGGVDLAMLVVAADEGVMPQTREHLEILTQLGIGDGIVVITKTDKVDSDWLELVTDDINQLTSGTFLGGKKQMFVSAVTGDGIDELKEELRQLIQDLKEKNVDVPFRLPVDRAFAIDGFGIVVTGTLIEGSINVGETVQIFPSGEKAPVRNIQVHGENSQSAYAGQRTAISLSGVKRGSIKKGDVLATDGTLNKTDAINVRLNVMPGTNRTVKNGAELHFYHGARAMLAKVFLYETNELHAGDSSFAGLKLKETLSCKRGDRFVIRFFSPIETIGGGVILDSKPLKRFSRTASGLDTLKIRETGSTKDVANLAAVEIGNVFSCAQLCRKADLDKNTCYDAITSLISDGSILELLDDKYISAVIMDKLTDECKETLTEYHHANPLRDGINMAELRQKIMPDSNTPEANAVFTVMKNNGHINAEGNFISLPGFSVAYSAEQTKIRDRILKEVGESGYDVKSPDELCVLLGKKEQSEFGQVFEGLITRGEIIKLSKQVYWLKSNYDTAIGLIKAHFDSSDSITLAECRDMLGTTRKYALTFLEYLDGKNVTSLHGDSRKLAKGFGVL